MEIIKKAGEDVVNILANTEGLGGDEKENLIEFVNLLTEFAIMKLYNKNEHLNPADFFGIDKEYRDGKNNS
jgi:hypothetical protein